MPSEVTVPVNLADVAGVLGVRCEYQPDLGMFGDRGRRFYVAGALDRQRELISVLETLSLEERRFTLGHEFTHWILHPNEVMHRDRPVAGLAKDDVDRLPTIEREANYGSGCLLMPRRLVEAELRATFGECPVWLTDDLRWYLDRHRGGMQRNHRSYAATIPYELAVASIESLGGARFDSMAARFQVSVPSMAIRLSQLALVMLPPGVLPRR